MGAAKTVQLGKYSLVARLATGGMAEIYLARQGVGGAFSRPVVVKRILPHLAEEPRFVEMFLEEARLASKIQHANVVQIFDVDHHERDFFIAMEYIDGLSVGSICRRARKAGVLAPTAVAVEIVAQACDGLHAAHELRDEDGTHLGLVHRDVSPHNLMVAKSGVVKLVDFGIAKATTTSIKTRTGDIKGKYPYMSPEQIRAEPLDRRTDIFSLGAILAELLLGRRFFERPSELATMKAITEEPIPALSDIDARVPRLLADVAARALQRDLGARFQTAAEMGVALRDALYRLGITTSQQTVASYLESSCQDLLEARSRAVRELGQLPARTASSVPRAEGFDESATSVGAAADPGAQTRSMRGPSLGEPVDDEAPTQVSAARPSMAEATLPLSGASGEAPQGSSATRRRSRTLLVTVLCLVVIGGGVGLAALLRGPSTPDGPALRWAHPPTDDAAVVREGLAPLVTYLQRRLDRPVEIVVTPDYATLRRDLISGRLHVADLSPLLFVQTRAADPNVVPLAAHTYDGARTYQAYLITRMDSDLTDITQLRGKRFCFVDRSSTSGYLLPRRHLRAAGLDPDRDLGEVRFSGTHTKVMNDVIAGRCDAGAVYSGAFASASSVGVAASRLRLFQSVGVVPWDVVTASSRFPASEADALRRALLDFDPQRDLGRAVLSDIFRIDGFVEPRLADFRGVEEAARSEGLLDRDPER